MTNQTQQFQGNITVGLDIGTTKVCVVVARQHSESLEIIGMAQTPSQGFRKGVVINIDATVEAIKKACLEAELVSGTKIEKVWIGVAGSHIRSMNSRGMVAVRHQEVQVDDIRRVIEAAQAVALPEDRQILHVLPQTYFVDSQEGIKEPLGMSGVRLESAVHLVTGLKTSLANINKCVDRAGLHSSGLVLESLASAESCLSADEKELGVAVVDMGGGTCDIIVYVNGSVAYTSVLPIGGQHLTHDISVGLRTPTHEAETLKKKYGCAMTSLVDGAETIEVASVGGRNPRTLSRMSLAEVIEPRIEETLNLIHAEIMKSGYAEQIGAGVVLTGGASQLEGIVEFGEFIFEMPVRRGVPLKTSGLTEVVHNPAFTTAVGLARYGAENKEQAKAKSNFSLVDKIKSRVTEFLDGSI